MAGMLMVPGAVPPVKDGSNITATEPSARGDRTGLRLAPGSASGAVKVDSRVPVAASRTRLPDTTRFVSGESPIGLVSERPLHCPAPLTGSYPVT